MPIRYVQPALGHNQGRSKDLLLVAFPLEQYSSAIISGEVLKAFLEEFYRALGVTNPRADTDFQRMTLDGSAHDRAESPVCRGAVLHIPNLRSGHAFRLFTGRELAWACGSVIARVPIV